MADDKRHLHAVNGTRSTNQAAARPWWGGWGMLTAAALVTGTGVVVTFFLTRALDRRFNPAPVQPAVAPPPVQPQVVVIRDEEALPRKHPMTSRFGEDDQRAGSERTRATGGDELRKEVESLKKQVRSQKRRLDELEGEDD